MDQDIIAQVAARNEVRREAKLPLLDQREVDRLETARNEAEFEQYFELQRNHYSHLWSDHRRGFVANAGIYSIVRKRLRDEMLKSAHGTSNS